MGAPFISEVHTGRSCPLAEHLISLTRFIIIRDVAQKRLELRILLHVEIDSVSNRCKRGQ